MPLSFSEILKDAPPGPAAAVPPPPPRPSGGTPSAPASAPDGRYARYENEKRLLDDVLKEVITEISQEIQRIGEALKAPPGGAAPAGSPAGPDASGPPPGRLLEEVLTAEERKALSDILRETPPRVSLAPPGVAVDDDLPMGGFAIPGSGEGDALAKDETGGLDALMALHGSNAPDSPAVQASASVSGETGSGVWVSPDALQKMLPADAPGAGFTQPQMQKMIPVPVESDDAMAEVEDLIKMHMEAYVEESKKEKEDEDKAGRAAAAAAGAELLAMVKPKGPSLLARFDAWVVARGLARHKRRAGIVAWAVLLGTLIGVGVTVWMRM